MESERKVKIISLVAVIVAVLGLTLAFAAMSRTLRINGTGKMDPVNWDIYFTNLSSATTKGEAQASGTPSLATKGAEISNLNATLKQPGDSVSWTVDIKNDGDIDAEISQINLPTLTNRNNQIFEFSATYTNEYEHGHTITVGDMLYAGETRNITIVFKYKDITDESLLPSSPEAINLSYSINYVQSNRASTITTTASPSSLYGEEIASTSLGDGVTATYYGGTPIAKASTGVQPMAYTDNRVADNVRYQGGTLVISGSGALPSCDNDFFKANIELLLFLADTTLENFMSNQSNYVDSSTGNFIFKYNPTNLVVSEGITSIGDYYFNRLHTITSVSLPSTLLTIEEFAFMHCFSLSTINIPSSVTTIGYSAFYECTSLTSITIPSSVTTIGEYAFTDCTSLTSISLPGNALGTRSLYNVLGENLSSL